MYIWEVFTFSYTRVYLFLIFYKERMSQKTTSLDIQKGEGSIIDIAQIFPMTAPRTLDMVRWI